MEFVSLLVFLTFGYFTNSSNSLIDIWTFHIFINSLTDIWTFHKVIKFSNWHLDISQIYQILYLPFWYFNSQVETELNLENLSLNFYSLVEKKDTWNTIGGKNLSLYSDATIVFYLVYMFPFFLPFFFVYFFSIFSIISIPHCFFFMYLRYE